METGSIPAKGLLIMSNCVICNLARLPKVAIDFDNCTLYTDHRAMVVACICLVDWYKMFHTAPFLNPTHAPHCLFLFLVARPLFSCVARSLGMRLSKTPFWPSETSSFITSLLLYLAIFTSTAYIV